LDARKNALFHLLSSRAKFSTKGETRTRKEKKVLPPPHSVIQYPT
jgi:hypothetical protein